MTEENERLDPEEIGELASTPFKTEIERKVVTDDEGNEFEIAVETRKTMSPSRRNHKRQAGGGFKRHKLRTPDYGRQTDNEM